MLQAAWAKVRQRRLLDAVRDEKLDAVVTGLPWHVYYLTAHLPHWLQHGAAVLWADGGATLVAANPAQGVAADEVLTYDANPLGTQRQEQPAVIAARVRQQLERKGARRVGIDASAVSSQVIPGINGTVVPIDSVLWQLRRPKDPDELALMTVAIDCTRAMYETARRIIEPGVPELKVYAELHAAAVEAAGEPISLPLGNDYACGVPGGPARQGRTAAAGELYILDLGPPFRGYFADNCRTFSVGRRPTVAQQRAWEAIVGVFPLVEKTARAGVRCRDLFHLVGDHYRSALGKDLPHHLGHGVGLQPHEYPHLNPRWDDVLIEGEIFTCEPGVYAPELAGGMRIENQYLVGKDGVENLTPFPTGLVEDA